MDLARRELLTMGGAGVAALALPSLLPDPVAFAQGPGPDPILAELARQFQRAAEGLGASPPRGNAQQFATLFRLLGAWARANNVDAIIRQRLNDAIASEGHAALVARLATADRVGALRARGVPLTPNVQNHNDPVAFAKAIGWYKAGMTIERLCRTMAYTINRRAATFDSRMAVLNNRQPEMVIRRVQDPVTCTYDPSACDAPPADDCTINADGSFSCTLTQPNVEPPAQGCDPVIAVLFHTAGYEIDIMMAMLAIGLWEMLLIGLVIDGFFWYTGC
jgi:hypothetical protein